MFKTKKKFLVAFLSLILTAQYSCKKDTTEEPIESLTIAEERYSIGAESTTSDIIQTSDGGYIMVGTSYASSNVEGDIVAIKTDANGLLQWSTLMGKAPDNGNLTGRIVKYDENGVKVIEETDGSFTLVGNRTYVVYPNTSTAGVPEQTKIVFYKLSAAGAATTTDGIELMPSTEFTEEVSDFKMDASNGSNKYILTGYTTNVQANKPNDTNNGLYDLTDIFTLSLDENFDLLWTASSSTYGFSGKDYGTSIQILPSGYLVVGTSEEHTSGSSYSSRIIAVILEKSGGTPLNVSYFENQGSELEGGYSVYDATTQLTTIVGNVTTGSSSFAGNLVALQIDNNLSVQINNGSGLEFIQPTAPNTTSTNNTFKAASIALIPNNGGFVIASTLSDNLGKDICITKLANDFSLPATDWPHYYSSANGISTSQELAGPVIPTLDTDGTVEYAYTGTFNANTTSSQIGWVLF